MSLNRNRLIRGTIAYSNLYEDKEHYTAQPTVDRPYRKGLSSFSKLTMKGVCRRARVWLFNDAHGINPELQAIRANTIIRDAIKLIEAENNEKA